MLAVVDLSGEVVVGLWKFLETLQDSTRDNGDCTSTTGMVSIFCFYTHDVYEE